MGCSLIAWIKNFITDHNHIGNTCYSCSKLSFEFISNIPIRLFGFPAGPK